jgi:hypothetical protein
MDKNLKDITDFLNEELNKSIDNITELKTQIQKMEIDMETSLSYSKNIKSRKDDTMDFFTLESDEDTFHNSEISNLNEEVESMSDKLAICREQLASEMDRLSDIRELLEKYSVADKDSVLDYSSNSKSNINNLIESADFIYDSVCDFVSENVTEQIEILSNNDKLITSLINSDPSRALLELEKNDKILNQLSHDLKQFSRKIFRYNSDFGFEKNFEYLCRHYNKEETRFLYSYNDDLNMSEKINDSKCMSYFKLVTGMIGFLENVSRETYKIDFINYKTKSKLLFTLDIKYEFIKEEFSDEQTADENSDVILLKFYLRVCNAYVKFKKTSGSFIIEIDCNLY